MAKITKQTIKDAKGKVVAIVLPIEEYDAMIEGMEDKEDIITCLQREISRLKGEEFDPIELKWESVGTTKITKKQLVEQTA